MYAASFRRRYRKSPLATLTPVIAQVFTLYYVWRWILLRAYRHIKARGLRGSGLEVYGGLKKIVIGILLALPSSRAKLRSELGSAQSMLETKLAPPTLSTGATYESLLPAEGKSADWLAHELDKLKGLEKEDVAEGRVSGAVYHGGGDSELNRVTKDAMSRFLVSNPLHPDVFPGVRKMEAEIVSMCLGLFNNPSGAGTTTSGGTESIIMSVKTHRDWARATKGITVPEMIISASAHAAFWKASDYLGIKLHVVPVEVDSRRADVRKMRRAINPNTIMLVGSAPNFPDGAIDPIPELAALARRHQIGLHVDCCLGSFLMPFLKRKAKAEGRDFPEFDFETEGVTSISCDTHKYGFCPKGSSVIMYRYSELRKYQYYIQTDWAGGVYASPSLAGSRPGSILAGAWAVMKHMGQDGYAKSCDQIVSAAQELKLRIRADFSPEDLYVLGDPLVSVVAFTSKSLNIYAIGDELGKRGWHLNGLANPPALHLAATLLSPQAVPKLLEDLHAVIRKIKENKDASATTLEGGAGEMVAMYGLGQTAVGPNVVSKLAEMFIDTLYVTR